jgi:uncharacterized protein YceK
MAFGIFCAAILTGCATSGNLTGKQIPYGGFWYDVTFRRQAEDVVGIGPVLAAVDAPLSFVGDTASLPITLGAATGRFIRARQNDAAERERRLPVTKVPPQSDPELPEE